MLDKLDKIDFKILKIFQESSKIINLEFFKCIGFFFVFILECVKKFENFIVIESYYVKVNLQLIGLNVKIFVLVFLAW